MTEEIKRLNYFTSQFLVEDDFKDEQAYHRRMRYLHNRSLHTWGVVEGLEVTESGDNKQVSVSSGMAIDSNGKEIVLLDKQTVSLSEFDAGSTVYITIAVQDFGRDEYTVEGEIKFTRTAELPLLKAWKEGDKPDDGAAVSLAKFQLDNSGNVGTIDYSVRRLASCHIPPGATFSGPLTIEDNLTVNGTVKATKFVGKFEGDGSGLDISRAEKWSDGSDGSSIYYTNGNVGIGTTKRTLKAKLDVQGKIKSQNTRVQAVYKDSISYSGSDWQNMPNMKVTFKTGDNHQVLILFKAGGVQAPDSKRTRAKFRLLVDSVEKASTSHEFHNKGWELRDVSLQWLDTLSSGDHTAIVQWAVVTAGKVYACWYKDERSLIAIEL